MRARRVALLLLVLGAGCGRTRLLPLTQDGGPRPIPDDAGAGTDAGPLACGPFAPCGGDPTGEWTVESLCLPDEAIPGCPGARVGFTQVRPEGSFSFGGDRYSSRLALSGALSLTMPISCVAQQSGVPPGLLNCLVVGLALQMAQPPVGSGITSVSCTGLEVCTCSLGFAAQTQSATGSYTTVGTSLLLDGGGQVQSLAYCTADPALLLQTQLTAPLMGNVDAQLSLRRAR
jgi:hypothetical protein